MIANQKLLIVSSLIVLTTVVLISGCGSKAATANANNAAVTIDVTTAQAIVKTIPTYFEATGNLAGDEQTDVAPAVSGKIVQVNFDVGSYVQKGSVLVRLDDRDARIRIEQAQAQVEQQKKALDQAVAGLRQAQVRLGVKDGETFDIATFSQVKSVNAQLVLAEKELQRSQKLFETGDVSRSTLDQRRSQRDALIGQLESNKFGRGNRRFSQNCDLRRQNPGRSGAKIVDRHRYLFAYQRLYIRADCRSGRIH